MKTCKVKKGLHFHRFLDTLRVQLIKQSEIITHCNPVLLHRVICCITCTTDDSLFELAGTEVVYTLFRETSLPLWVWHHDNFKTLQKLLTSQVALVVKNPPARAGDARDTGSVPGWGRTPGGGNGNPLHILAWRMNPMDRGAWKAAAVGTQRAGCDWACRHKAQQHKGFQCRLWMSGPTSSRTSTDLPATRRRARS